MLPPLVIAQAKKSTNQNQLIRYKIEAFNAGNEAPVNYQKEIDICNEGLKEFSGDPDLRELLAEGFVGIGNYKRAEALFRELITSKNPEDRATRFWVLGAYQRMLLKQNRTRDAEDVGQELTALKR
jgi:tetratricopeptide (TPR) repeat protein